MSRTVRFASTLLILAVLTCGSLGAWPLGVPMAPAETSGGDFLTAVVEWIGSIFAPERPAGDNPVPQAKEGVCIDPAGGPCGGGH